MSAISLQSVTAPMNTVFTLISCNVTPNLIKGHILQYTLSKHTEDGKTKLVLYCVNITQNSETNRIVGNEVIEEVQY